MLCSNLRKSCFLALGRCGVGTLKNENVAKAITICQKKKKCTTACVDQKMGIFSKHPTVESCYLDLLREKKNRLRCQCFKIAISKWLKKHKQREKIWVPDSGSSKQPNSRKQGSTVMWRYMTKRLSFTRIDHTTFIQ